MKNLLLLLLAFGLTLPMSAQSGGKSFYKALALKRNIDPAIKKASAGVYRTYGLRDSLLYFTARFEKAVLQTKSAGAIKPEIIKLAQKKYPGNTLRAVRSRLELYAKEGQ